MIAMCIVWTTTYTMSTSCLDGVKEPISKIMHTMMLFNNPVPINLVMFLVVIFFIVFKCEYSCCWKLSFI